MESHHLQSFSPKISINKHKNCNKVRLKFQLKVPFNITAISSLGKNSPFSPFSPGLPTKPSGPGNPMSPLSPFGPGYPGLPLFTKSIYLFN